MDSSWQELALEFAEEEILHGLSVTALLTFSTG
jgi:hypothetical protein